ncbi:MAG: HipA domain-containing protein [Victivallaceae bacterium]|nr:HipA domain-containing protein [Victivallaceae bacterium]
MMEIRRCLRCGEPLGPLESSYHARCVRKLFGSSRIPAFDYTQDELNALARKTIASRISVPGVQPKLSLHLERGGASPGHRLTLVGLDGDYILKPQTPLWPFLPEAEHFCMLLARRCRISTADCGLIPLKSGELAYVTRRMDRAADGAMHMEDFCQILDKLTEQKYNGSMEQIGKAIRMHSDAAGLDLVRFFELSIYCFLTGNSDMHLKNFSLIRLRDGRYELSPAYDLVPVRIIMPQDKEELALTLNGKKSRLGTADFERFGFTLGLTAAQVKKTMRNITGNVIAELPAALDRSFMPQEMRERTAALVKFQFARLSPA